MPGLFGPTCDVLSDGWWYVAARGQELDDPRPLAQGAIGDNEHMRYLVTARVKAGREAALAQAIEDGSLGRGSVAGSEYQRTMACARLLRDGQVRWVEICFCDTPLFEERPYWEEFFEFIRIQDAHARTRCRDLNGADPWACSDCDCTDRLDERMRGWGTRFIESLATDELAGHRVSSNTSR